MLGCKLNRKTVQTLITNGTSTDISLLFHVSRLANDNGYVENLNYKEISSAVNCSVQSYYNSLKRLERTKLISLNKSLTETNCIIRNNKFLQKNYKDGYVNTNLDFLYSEEFKEIKLNAKKIALLYFLGKNKNGVYEVSRAKLIQHLGGLERRSLIWEYIDQLKKWFNIHEEKTKDGKDIKFYISLKDTTSTKLTKDLYWEHQLSSLRRRHKAKMDSKNINEVITLIKIYGYKDYFKKQFRYLLKTITDTIKELKELRADVINKRIREHFEAVNLPIPKKKTSTKATSVEDDLQNYLESTGRSYDFQGMILE
ncbi:hypothetical protein [Clostridium sp.]|uniref:hypothetical protein n=1 Tax=Clostridium sp. TaxID=1506 RepID=UPI002FCB5873